jgi:peptide/nickel transport system substrate-binding protein
MACNLLPGRANGSRTMDHRDLRGLIERVKRGRLSRRGFIRRLAAVGLSAPLANQILALSGVAMAQPSPSYAYKPTKAGGGGTLKLLWWQGPTLLNPHFAVGTKDQDGSRLFYEPLAAWDSQANLQPILAAELPTLENGGLAGDGKSVVWKLKQGVKWHDGKPFTADDVVFNWAYARDPATAAVTAGSYNTITAEKLDDHTVRLTSETPRPFWAEAFVSATGMIIPKHLFENYTGAKSREAPTNLAPVGTGPYLFKEFRPGDIVSGVINPNYHKPNRPYFDAVEMKGGGDAASAARAVLQTGEYDFAWNMQVEDDVLTKLEASGKGHVRVTDGGSLEQIFVNFTDPNVEVDGERSSLKTKHPSLSDPAVRQALSLLIDKDSVHKYIYGRAGAAVTNVVYNPPRYNSPNTKWEFNIEKANAILDKAGWKPGPDGIRAKDGKTLSYLYQTSTNQPRQKTQQIVKQACKKAGINLEIKSVVSSVFFSSDVANPDTYPHFYADLEMYTTGPNQPDPSIWLQLFLGSEAAQKDNKWQGRNITRWQNDEFDRIYHQQESELDPVKRTALLIKLNDLVINNFVSIPVVTRPNVAAVKDGMVCELSGFDSYIWDLADWYMTT